MKEFPGRLSHKIPGWVKRGSIYHIRIRTGPSSPRLLIHPPWGTALLDSALFYHQRGRWYCRLFLLMPDHLHALLAFPPDKRMSDIIGTWKGFQTKQHRIQWQDNYFDHRIRSDAELDEKFEYILRNPAVKNLCPAGNRWPWMLMWPE